VTQYIIRIWGVIYHACTSTPMYQLAHEIYSACFTKDIIWAKFKEEWVT